MAAITISNLENAKLDVDHIADIANSQSLTATDRLGHTKKTLNGYFSDVDTFISKKMDDVDLSVSSKISEIDAVIADQFNLSAATAWKYKIGTTSGTAAGQTTFESLDLEEGNVEVFYNGSHLFHPDDFSYTNTTLTLKAPCVIGDVVIINNFRYPVTVIDGGTYE